MNSIISQKHLRKCSPKQRHIWYVIELWIIGGALGITAILIPLAIKHPDAIPRLIRALTP